MKHTYTGISLLIFLLLLSGGLIATEKNFPVYFRSNNGTYTSRPGSLPDRLDSPELLLWRTPIDAGHSTPVVVKDRIFLTTFNTRKNELATVALDFETGKILWKQIASTAGIEEYNRVSGSAAQATPASDGQRIYVFFGSYGLICYDLDGKTLWEHRMGPFRDEYGSASSPILVDGKVIIQQDHDVDSFLMALDGSSGKVLWKTERPNATRSYSTPVVWTRNGKKELLVAGSIELSGYDPGDGKRLWWIGGLARIVIPTPVPADKIIYMASWSPGGGDYMRRARMETWPDALRRWDRNGDEKLSQYEARNPDVRQRFVQIDIDQNGELDRQEWERFAAVFQRAQNSILAIKPSAEDDEQNTDSVLWQHSRGAPYVSTPLLDQGILWVVKDGGIVTKLLAESGKLLQEKRLPDYGNYYASPVSADGKVFIASERGVVSILSGGTDWNVLSHYDLGEKIYATPFVAENRLFIRTERALYCFQKKSN